jgi:hypothetical protein
VNQNLTWKQELLIALVCYAIKFLLSTVLPTLLLVVLEIVGLIMLILGIIGALKVAFGKSNKKK